MSWMDKVFGAKPAAQAPAVASNNPATQTSGPAQQTQQTAQTDANGVVPAGGGAESPLKEFATLWEPTKVDPNAPQNKTPEPITAEKMMEAAGKVDFSKVLSQEEIAKVVAGGEGAAQALVAILNKTMQTSYGHAALAATRLTEQAVSQAEQSFLEKLPTIINQQSSKNALLESNKAFQDPAVAPIVQMIHTQIQQKFPNSTPTEVAAMAKEMMQGAAKIFNPDTQSAEQQAASKAKTAQEDWSSYMG